MFSHVVAKGKKMNLKRAPHKNGKKNSRLEEGY